MLALPSAGSWLRAAPMPPSSSGEHRIARLARNMDRRCAIGLAKPLGVQQPEARAFALADDYDAATRRVATQLLVFWGVDTARRQLDDGDRHLRGDRAEDAGDAVVLSRGSVENRHAGDTSTVEFEICVNRNEPIECEFLDRGCCAKAGGLLDQPIGAGLIAHCSCAMNTLRIPCPQPRGCAGNSVVGQARTGTGWRDGFH